MTVMIQAADLVQPLGKLEGNFFPDGNMNVMLGGWFAQAKSKVEASTINAEHHDEAARQWAYYLAFDYIAGRFASMPNSASVNKGADEISYGQDRPPYWRARAAEALGAYNGFGLVITQTTNPRSMSVPLQVVY